VASESSKRILSDGGTVTQAPTLGSDLTLGDADPTIASLEDVYLDGTLVLVGCGKAKRDPEDPVDLHEAVVGPDEKVRKHGPSGPAWRAEDLYTSTYFSAKREFAETVTQWASGRDGWPWSILSAEHDVLPPWKPVPPYDTTIDDLGGDETNPDHWVRNSYNRRRPDGREIVTELDKWAASVATGLARWTACFREQGAPRSECDANTLLVLAGEKYVEPLRDRGVFEYGISRMTGDPNHGFTLPVETRFLFEEIDAGGIGEQMAWLSDAVDRLDHEASDAGDQHGLGDWTGVDHVCAGCGESPPETQVDGYGGETYCEDCAPRRCSRCGGWTHETGLGSYPLCGDCQTDAGGQKRTPFGPETTEQLDLVDSVVATDGGNDDSE